MEIVKGGRPVKVLTETDVTKLEALACVLTKSQVADYFGMTEKTLRAVEERQPEVNTAYRKGKAMAIASVATSLYDQAMAGNFYAMKFYLQTQAGWSEKRALDLDIRPAEDRDWTINIVRAKPDLDSDT
jgi:hypothetical protein|tara:strand:+ start:39 stop:425 length:387 start_codon:yes stop_codon:yes gene_type:complete